MFPAILAGAQLAISLGGALFGHKAQKKQANASEQAAARTLAETTRSANQAAGIQNATLDLRLDQEQQAANLTLAQNTRAGAQSILAADRAARMADATARLSAGAAGVEGVSVDALTQDIARQDATARFDTTRQVTDAARTIQTNLQWTREQTELQRQGIEADRQSRINAATNLPTSPQPSPWLTGLQIGGSVLDLMNTLQRKKP